MITISSFYRGFMSTHAPIDATTALAQAEALQAAVNRQSRWYARYLMIYGTASFVLMLILGLAPRDIGEMIAWTFWGVVLSVLIIYTRRQPVARRGLRRRNGVIVAIWVVLYFLVFIPGTHWFQGDITWRLPGALVVALPAFVGAYLEARR
jgi:hypothetical protein